MGKKLFLYLTLLFFIVACSKPANSGLDLSHFDKSVRPQDDLYRFVNGTWLKEFEIPADKSNYGSFTKLYDEAQENLRSIIEESAKANAAEGTDKQKVGDLYASYMDTTGIEKIGLTPLKPYLEKISTAKSKKDLESVMVDLQKIGVGIPLALFVAQDAKNSSVYMANIYQSGLTLPDKSYYEKQDAKFVDIRKKYLAHMEKIFELSGIPNGAKKAKQILELETNIAKHHWTRTENRNRDKTYNKLSIMELSKLMPNFNWTNYLAASKARVNEVRVYQPSFLSGLSEVLAKTPLETWKDYYTWQIITSFASTLGKAFDKENFDFFSTTLRGVKEQSKRWKRAVNTVSGSIGEVVGKVYVEKHFKPEAKARMNGLIDNLVTSFKSRIDGLKWMSDETKVKAKEKLKKFARKIAYPDKWKDYSALKITKDNITQNRINSNIWGYNYNINKLGKPINRDEWGMTPQTVNAYYNPSKNEIVFPAAILQAPFFNMDADDAVNYGGIGAVIGHELSHGFDDQGAKSDGDGNLKNWWTDSDKKSFEELGNRLVAQYNSYSPIDSMHVNGRLTLGENIGDLGGLTVAYHAYKNSLNGKEAPTLDGFTGEQRFFMGWAQVWGRKYREKALRNRLITDPHSPSEYRCNGVITNMPEFYTAFNLKEGDKLFKKEEDRITIW